MSREDIISEHGDTSVPGLNGEADLAKRDLGYVSYGRFSAHERWERDEWRDQRDAWKRNKKQHKEVRGQLTEVYNVLKWIKTLLKGVGIVIGTSAALAAVYQAFLAYQNTKPH